MFESLIESYGNLNEILWKQIRKIEKKHIWIIFCDFGYLEMKQAQTNKCGKRYYFDRIKYGKGMCVEEKLISYAMLTDKLLFKFYSNQLWRCPRSVLKNLSFCDLNIQSQFVWFGSETLSVQPDWKIEKLIILSISNHIEYVDMRITKT